MSQELVAGAVLACALLAFFGQVLLPIIRRRR